MKCLTKEQPSVTRAQSRGQKTAIRLRHVVRVNTNPTTCRPSTSQEVPSNQTVNEVEITTSQGTFSSNSKEEQIRDETINLEGAETISKFSEAMPPITEEPVIPNT